MIDACIGATHVNAFLTAVKIPPIHPKTLKSYERYVGKNIEAAADKSCQDSILLERYVWLVRYLSSSWCFILMMVYIHDGTLQWVSKQY